MALLLEKADGKMQEEFTAYLMVRSRPNANQLFNSDWLQRAMLLLMEIYDDSATLVLPFDCHAVRQLALLQDQPMHLKKLLVGLLSSQSVRSKFTAQGCLQLQ